MRIGAKRGVALITTLLFVAVLVAMVSALFLVVRTKLFQSQGYENQTAALYLAELGVADAMSQLEADPTWTAGFSNKSYPGVTGRYSVTFNTGGPPYDKMQSVNNIDGLHDETYRGPQSLLPGQCMLVATATVGQSTRTVEAIVDMGGGLMPLDGPLVVDGRVVMDGKVNVDGVKSLYQKPRIPVNIQCNLSDAASNLVVVDDSQSPFISGTVTIVSSAAGSVNLGSYSPAGGPPVLGSPPKTVPPIDIVTKVSSKSGAAAVPLATPVQLTVSGPGSPIAAFADATVLDHTAGPDFYSGTSLTVGDLKLNGAALYVNGDLTVNGGIEGTGSVWVTGNTTFRGTSTITTATPDKVALYSKGNVELTGFDGTALLNQYGVTDPRIAASVATIGTARADIMARLPALNAVSDLGDGNGLDLDINFNRPGGQAWLGSGYGSSVQPAMGSAANLVYTDPGISSGGRHKDAVPGSRLLFGRAQTPERDFLIRRFYQLYELNYGGVGGGWIDNFGVAEAKAGRLGLGSVDGVNDGRYLPGIELVRRFYENFSLNYIGSSYFQGQIYTNGYFHSVNDVTIVGAIVTDVDPSARAGANITDSIPDPGDVVLENGSRLLFVEDFFKPRAQGTATSDPRVRLRVWCGR